MGDSEEMDRGFVCEADFIREADPSAGISVVKRKHTKGLSHLFQRMAIVLARARTRARSRSRVDAAECIAVVARQSMTRATKPRISRRSYSALIDKALRLKGNRRPFIRTTEQIKMIH